ncbi:O-antigen ligase family protein [Anaeromyxobacter oryzisoli]|uniref:O-antigen ligase family protein n=1 Tax=Anaeromyxobacter oryzisoli TaxID=2925408 RepID=UPI001F57FD26|nr:O-antigen ligase family protein [Anaeromyxobacter sp. SG63]
MTTAIGAPPEARAIAAHRAERTAAQAALAVGLAFDAASLFVANPYVVDALTAIVVGFAVVRWRNRRLAWIALASALAANPVNLSASIACNLLVAAAVFLLDMPQLLRLPRWNLAAIVLALLAVVFSVFSWELAPGLDAVFTQVAAIANYVLGPLLLLPVLYSRIASEEDGAYRIRGLLLWLLLPSIVLVVLARVVGNPVADPVALEVEYRISWVYRLWNVEVTLTRTQVGIILAVILCAAIAVIVLAGRGWVRWGAMGIASAAGAMILVTGSVGSAIAAFLGLLAIVVVARRKVGIGEYVTTGLLIGAVVAAGWRLVPNTLTEYLGSRYEERFGESAGIGASDRTERWSLAASYALANPTGVGWSLYVEPIGTYPHNDFLAYSIGYGLLAGAVYLFVVCRLWWRFAWGPRKAWDRSRFALGLAGLGAVSVLLVNSMSDHLTANRWYFNVVWSVIWYCYFASQPRAPESSVARGFGYEGGGLRE